MHCFSFGTVLLVQDFGYRNAPDEITLKIADFDNVREHVDTMIMSIEGTVAYMAPEVLTTDRFSKASDIWR